MKTKTIKSTIFLLSTISIFTFGGCARVQRTEPNQQGTPNVRTPQNVDIMPGAPSPAVPNVVPGTQVGADAGRRAKAIEDRVRNIDQIRDCRVVLSDNVALVGVNTNEKVNGIETDPNLKEAIVNEVKNNAPGITRVSVTESPEMYTRIERLSQDITGGNTMRGFADEVRDIMNAIAR